MTAVPDREAVVALLPWGDLAEDFLGGIGVSVETFATEMDGGWLFGYVEALRRVGVRTVIVCVSARVSEPTRFVNGPTGAAVWVLPALGLFRRLRGRMRDPMGWTVEAMFGPARGPRRAVQRLIRDAAPYLATPPRLLAQVLRRERCTAVLCQEYEYPRFDVSVAVGRRLGLPVFATFQGGDWQTSRIERVVRPRALRAAAGLVIPTSTEAARVRARYGVPEEKIAAIFNPLDVAAWRMPPKPEARAALGLPSEAAVAVWHGRVDIHRKGLDVLLDAWAAVVRGYPDRDLRLLLIGTGTSSAELRRRLADPVFGGVTWFDEYVLDRERLRGYLAAADLYAFPSRHEGFPVALMEAMAAGLPVVAADAPGVPDILGTDTDLGMDTGASGAARPGIMVPRGDASALASALRHLIEHPYVAEQMGRNARHLAEQTFGLEAVGRQLRSFFLAQTDARHGAPSGID